MESDTNEQDDEDNTDIIINIIIKNTNHRGNNWLMISYGRLNGLIYWWWYFLVDIIINILTHKQFYRKG